MTATKKHTGLFWTLSILVLLLLLFLGLFAGRYSMSPLSVLKVMTGQAGTDLLTEKQIILFVRLPRVLLAAIVGCGLAVSGAAYQGIFQNPLVSPDVLSVSSGAAFGAVLSILLVPASKTLLIVLASVFGLLSVALTYWLSRVEGRTSTLNLVLAGMVISALFNALVSLMKYTADTDTELPAITYWLLGSIANATYSDVLFSVIPVLLGTAVLVAMGGKINILSLGDEEARALGMDPRRPRAVVIFAATVVTASCITVTGIIGWVGLVIPHIARMLIGPDHTKLIGASAVIGAGYLVLIDLLARTVSPSEIPIGILTALIGAPFFAVLFKRSRGGIA